MEQQNTSFPAKTVSSKESTDYLKIKELICKQIMFAGQKLDIYKTVGPERFEELIDEVFYEKILKISKKSSKEEFQSAFEKWAKIAKGLNPQKKKSYLFTSIKNAWLDVIKSVAYRAESNTANLVDEKPHNRKEYTLGTLEASDTVASIERPETHRDSNVFEFKHQHKIAACKLFFELTREERALLSLTYNDELGLIEIGKRTGISKSSVKRRRDALYHRLKTFLTKEASLKLSKADLYEVFRCMLDLFEQEHRLDAHSFRHFTVEFLQNEKKQGGNP